jgi:outer membrane protein TolC
MNGGTISVNIPIFYRSKQRQAEAEATEDVLGSEKMRENRLNEVRFELKQEYLAAKAADHLLSLYSKGIVPQASLALESSMAGYQVGNVDFLSVLANFTTVLNYETDYYRQLADYLTAIARMESLTGTDITSPPPSDSAAPAKKGM